MQTIRREAPQLAEPSRLWLRLSLDKRLPQFRIPLFAMRANLARHCGLKVLPQAGLLEHAICRVPRENLRIDHEVALGRRTEPDVVVALAMANAVAACFPEQLPQFGREVSHVGSPGSVRLDADEFLLAPE